MCVVICAVRCAALCPEMPLFRGVSVCCYVCRDVCSKMCRLGCRKCVVLCAHPNIAPKRLAPSEAPKLWAPRAGVHSKRLRSPKTAAPSAGQRARAADGYGAAAVSDCAEGCRACARFGIVSSVPPGAPCPSGARSWLLGWLPLGSSCLWGFRLLGAAAIKAKSCAPLVPCPRVSPPPLSLACSALQPSAQSETAAAP